MHIFFSCACGNGGLSPPEFAFGVHKFFLREKIPLQLNLELVRRRIGVASSWNVGGPVLVGVGRSRMACPWLESAPCRSSSGQCVRSVRRSRHPPPPLPSRAMSFLHGPAMPTHDFQRHQSAATDPLPHKGGEGGLCPLSPYHWCADVTAQNST